MLRLRSGDVVIQGGRSRGYVHGVPRVLPNTLPPPLHAEAADGAVASDAMAELAPFARWLAEHRLNINVRQVFGDEGPPPPLSDAEAEGEAVATRAAGEKRQRDG